MTGRRIIIKGRKNFFSLSISFSFGLLWIFLFAFGIATLPVGQVVSSPYFYEKIIRLSNEPEDFLTTLSLDRWGFLTEHTYLPPVPEIISPTPQIVLPSVEVQAEEVPFSYPQVEGDWEIITMGGKDSHLYHQGIYVANAGKVPLTVADLGAFSSLSFELEDSPQILIYHSHGTESYSQCEGYFYEESDPFRTTDMTQNITTVGAAMAEVFREAGFTVIHDTTLHDYPDYNSSYENSGKTLDYYLETYPSIILALEDRKSVV